ncbi:MAG: hypothetical protein RJB62_224 [Pseudomonadota bacterium]|jgi:hypothetical protein
MGTASSVQTQLKSVNTGINNNLMGALPRQIDLNQCRFPSPGHVCGKK